MENPINPRAFMIACALGASLTSQAEAQQDEDISVDARTAPEAVRPDTGPAARRAIDEIIVTATKRETSVRDIAGSVSALIGQDLEDAGIQDVNQIVEAVPGVNLIETGGSTDGNSRKSITIRGISHGNNQADTVGIFIDETPFSDPFFVVANADANAFDMATVEVLKGPVGTLFGGSALNGAIRYIPVKPHFDGWESKAFAEVRSFEHGGLAPIVGAALNVPLFRRDDLALRVTGVDRKTAGWIDNINRNYAAKDYNTVDQSALRLQLAWQPQDQLEFDLMWLSQDTVSNGFANASASRNGRYESTGAPQPSHVAVGYDTLQLKGTWSPEWADLIFIWSDSDKYIDGYYDYSMSLVADPPSSVLLTTYVGSSQNSSQELRLVSNSSGRWDWIGGLFNYAYDLDLSGIAVTGNSFSGAVPSGLLGVLEGANEPVLIEEGATVTTIAVQGQVTERAAFGELNWRFANSFELTGGLRLYQFSYDALITYVGALGVAVNPTEGAAGGGRADIPVDETEQGFSPKLSLKWEPLDVLMVYATLARGFRFGAANTVSHPEVPRVFESDALWSAEIGARMQWLDNTLTTDATVFAIDWVNAQFQTFTSDGAFGYTDNVGRVSGQGVEGQINWLTPLDGVSLTVTAAYADIRTAEDFTAPNGATTPAGTPWPKAPKCQTVTSLAWERPVGGAQIRAALSHSYFGEALQQFANPTRVFGYSNYALQVTLNPLDGRLPSLAVNVNNLTAVRGPNFVHNDVATGEPTFTAYTPPRNVSLRLTWDF